MGQSFQLLLCEVHVLGNILTCSGWINFIRSNVTTMFESGLCVSARTIVVFLWGYFRHFSSCPRPIAVRFRLLAGRKILVSSRKWWKEPLIWEKVRAPSTCTHNQMGLGYTMTKPFKNMSPVWLNNNSAYYLALLIKCSNDAMQIRHFLLLLWYSSLISMVNWCWTTECIWWHQHGERGGTGNQTTHSCTTAL